MDYLKGRGGRVRKNMEIRPLTRLCKAASNLRALGRQDLCLKAKVARTVMAENEFIRLPLPYALISSK